MDKVPRVKKTDAPEPAWFPETISIKVTDVPQCGDTSVAFLNCVANNLPYYRDINEKYHIGIVRDLEAVESFAAAVREIFIMDLGKLKKNALKAYGVLNWDKESEKLLGLYSRIERAV